MAFDFPPAQTFTSSAAVFPTSYHSHSQPFDSTHTPVPPSPAASDRKPSCADPRSLHHSPSRLDPYSSSNMTSLAHHPADFTPHDQSPLDGAFQDPASYHYRSSIFPQPNQHFDPHYPIACEDMFANPETNAALTPPESEVSPDESPSIASVKMEAHDRQACRNGSTVTQLGFVERVDGFRKKNAKFDIPEDRNLANVDSMIERAKRENNESELKELKTHKRLLRNREAALHSRQKKKDHANRLEIENKSFRELIGSLQQQLNSQGIIVDNARQQRQQALMLQNQFEQRTRQMAFEKDNLIRVHKQEVERLQAQINMLQQGVPSDGGAPPLSSVPSSTGYSGDSAIEMAGPSEFTFDFVDESCMGPNALSYKTQISANFNTDSATGQPLASIDAVLMLLMAGALAAFPSSQPLVIPHLPDSIKAVAPSILDTIFKCANPASGSSGGNYFTEDGHNITVDEQVRNILAGMVKPETVIQFRQLVQHSMRETVEASA